MGKKLIIAIFLILFLTSCSLFSSNDERYKLFPTKNMWTFLKLDTQTGMIWQVQFSVKGKEYRFQSDLSTIDLVRDHNHFNGRFTLHSTDNIYNFILIDQYDGRIWQVQWGENNQKAVIKIN